MPRYGGCNVERNSFDFGRWSDDSTETVVQWVGFRNVGIVYHFNNLREVQSKSQVPTTQMTNHIHPFWCLFYLPDPHSLHIRSSTTAGRRGLESVLLRPASRGRVTLRAAEPRAEPVVEFPRWWATGRKGRAAVHSGVSVRYQW